MGSDGPFALGDVTYVYGGDREKTRVGVAQHVGRGVLRPLGAHLFRELGGPKEKVFCAAGLKVKADRVRHDAMLHKWVMQVPNARFALAYDCDPATRADGEGAFSSGKKAFLEMDMETESLSTVMQRLAVYEPEDKTAPATFALLFITLNRPRIEKLKLRLKDRWVSKCVLFAVWYDLIADGTGGQWESIAGKKSRVCPVGG